MPVRYVDLALGHVLSTVDLESCAEDKAGVIIGEKCHHASNVRRRTKASDRDAGDDRLQDFVGHGRDHVGIAVASKHR
jgi:hypothetical protein